MQPIFMEGKALKIIENQNQWQMLALPLYQVSNAGRTTGNSLIEEAFECRSLLIVTLKDIIEPEVMVKKEFEECLIEIYQQGVSFSVHQDARTRQNTDGL